MSSLQDFMKLSELLTGFTELDPATGDDYRRQLTAAAGLALGELVTAFREVRGERDVLAALILRFGGDPLGQRLRFTAQQIVRIWYLSEFTDATGTLISAGHYLDSALYRVIEAHPQGYSDQPYGYWAKRPHARRESV